MKYADAQIADLEHPGKRLDYALKNLCKVYLLRAISSILI